ncbi:hypothetical protein [Thioalkalivibrio thiocyanodenitrificans]|uniref:hypothetical protein n=1 Tax=Thioalkalivibrio thiocyanodenitrificans TaxID=243063 RepID=UPI000362E29B|nr:hypothetical protein [Thioalkalivibrio thiocyanodenitrificans]
MTRVRRTGLVILLCAGLSALYAGSLSADENPLTHQANIRGLVDRPTASGRGVVLRVDAPDRIRVVHSVQ